MDGVAKKCALCAVKTYKTRGIAQNRAQQQSTDCLCRTKEGEAAAKETHTERDAKNALHGKCWMAYASSTDTNSSTSTSISTNKNNTSTIIIWHKRTKYEIHWEHIALLSLMLESITRVWVCVCIACRYARAYACMNGSTGWPPLLLLLVPLLYAFAHSFCLAVTCKWQKCTPCPQCTNSVWRTLRTSFTAIHPWAFPFTHSLHSCVRCSLSLVSLLLFSQHVQRFTHIFMFIARVVYTPVNVEHCWRSDQKQFIIHHAISLSRRDNEKSHVYERNLNAKNKWTLYN